MYNFISTQQLCQHRSPFRMFQSSTHAFVPTTREGNVFRGVCLTTGGCLISGQRPHLWTDGQRPPFWSEIPSDREPPWKETPLARDPLVLTSSGSHCSSRYASYWNAFLFHNAFLFTPPSMHNAILPFTN